MHRKASLIIVLPLAIGAVYRQAEDVRCEDLYSERCDGKRRIASTMKDVPDHGRDQSVGFQ